MEVSAKIVSNVDLKPLTILTKSSILDALLGPKLASAVEYNPVLKIQTEISHWQQVKEESFQSTITVWSLGQKTV